MTPVPMGPGCGCRFCTLAGLSDPEPDEPGPLPKVEKPKKRRFVPVLAEPDPSPDGLFDDPDENPF